MQLRKVVSTFAKLAISGSLIGYLIFRAAHDPQFGELLAGKKNWPILLCTLPVCLFAVTVTILRWHLLIRALGLSFTVRETLRAGFLGYLANLMPFGLVAGDSLKAVILIHRNPAQDARRGFGAGRSRARAVCPSIAGRRGIAAAPGAAIGQPGRERPRGNCPLVLVRAGCRSHGRDRSGRDADPRGNAVAAMGPFGASPR